MRRSRSTRAALAWHGGVVAVVGLTACSVPTVSAVVAPDAVRPTSVEPLAVPRPDPSAVHGPAGYRCEAVVTGLTYPTSAELDDAGNLYVAEAGFMWGDPWGLPRVLRVSPAGEVHLLTDRLVAPITDLLWHEGQLYVSHRGKVSRIGPDGAVQDLVTGLPSVGDHGNNQLCVGPDGKLYFGQGTVTNSGVVGLDSFLLGWLQQFPDAHDRPARDMHASTDGFKTVNPFLLAGGEGDYTATTAPFSPFGADAPDDPGADGRRIIGSDRPTGCIYRCNLDGSALEVYAWGLRNPMGVMWGNDGQLYASNQGMDERGSRPIANAPDDLILIKQNAWYGWPDYAGGQPITQHHFRPAYGDPAEFILEDHPPIDTPLLTLAPNCNVAKMARPVGERFGAPRELFLAVLGDFRNGRGLRGTGPCVLRIDPLNRRTETLMASSDERTIDQGLGAVSDPGHASAGLRRPIDIVFSRDGDALYVVDVGVVNVLATKIPTVRPYPGTGVVWRLVPDDVPEVRPRAGVSLQPPPVPVEAGTKK